MGQQDPRVDAYIEKSPEFARPILTYLREVIHAACPEVEETMKWSRPHFQYRGMLCGISSFKHHCAFGFWKGSLVVESSATADEDDKSMGQFGKLAQLSDLPSKKVLTGYIKKAMKLNDDGVKSPARSAPKVPKPEVAIPEALTLALAKNEAAQAYFAKLSPSHRREYIDWINEAKTEGTRSKRLNTTLEWLAEGKSRNWKYSDC